MNQHILFALGHPVYDPARQILEGHRWREGQLIGATLTCNIGDE